jgi:hypothetical protein
MRVRFPLFAHHSYSFDGVFLRSDTQQLLSQKNQGNDLVWLNRLLLEDAYPPELSRNPDGRVR